MTNETKTIISLTAELCMACRMIKDIACKDCKRKACKSEETNPDGTKSIIDECPISKDTQRWDEITKSVRAYTQVGYLDYMTAQIEKSVAEWKMKILEDANPNIKDGNHDKNRCD